MKNPIIALAAVLLMGTGARGQDVSMLMRLSLAENQELGQPWGSPDERLIEDNRLPLTRLFGTEVTNEPSDSGQQTSVAEAAIKRLNQPLSKISLSGLAQTPPALAEMNAEEISQLGFSQGPAKLITAGGWATNTSFESVTTYVRQPLYFEDSALERCGQSDGCLRTGCWTNWRSAAKFLLDTALLPCRMIQQHPGELVTAVAE
jgi:hypothetical protein